MCSGCHCDVQYQRCELVLAFQSSFLHICINLETHTAEEVGHAKPEGQLQP